MTPYRTAHPIGQKWLAWLLLVAVALMGLTITRQQALGSLHSHADQGPRMASALSAAVSNLGNHWINRWQLQQAVGHGQLLANAGSDGMPDATGLHDSDPHDHDALERHHHAAHDASVLAVDGAAESAAAADSAASGGSVVLSGFGVPSAGLVVPTMTGFNGPWPVGRLAAFVSRSVPPLLRPPSL